MKKFHDKMIQAFSTPILYRSYSNNNRLNKRLKKTLWEIEEHFDSINHGDAYCGGYYTQQYSFKEDYDGFKELRTFVLESIRYYAEQILLNERNIKLKIDPEQIELSGWLGIIGNGDYQSPYINSDTMISCIYFIDVPEEKGVSDRYIDLLTPYDTRELSFFKGAKTSHRRITPQEGTLVIYPSYCRRFIHPHQGENEHILAEIKANLEL